MKEIEVVRGSALRAGYSTPGIVREKAFESLHRYIIVSRTSLAGRAVSDWHHHGTRHLYGFLQTGRMRLEYRVKGERRVELIQGDFFHIHPGLVHRDVNPEKDRELVVVNILVGRGEPVINVRGPSNPEK
jgi:quercetin dioxygenase-like cupin family protein